MSQPEMITGYTLLNPDVLRDVLPTLNGLMTERFGMPADAICIAVSVVTKSPRDEVSQWTVEVRYASS